MSFGFHSYEAYYFPTRENFQDSYVIMRSSYSLISRNPFQLLKVLGKANLMSLWNSLDGRRESVRFSRRYGWLVVRTAFVSAVFAYQNLKTLLMDNLLIQLKDITENFS